MAHLYRFPLLRGGFKKSMRGYNIRLFWEAEHKNPSDNDKMIAFVAVVINNNNDEVFRHREECKNFGSEAARPGAAYPNGLRYDCDAAEKAENTATYWAATELVET